MKKTLKYLVKKVDMEGIHIVFVNQSHIGKTFSKFNNNFTSKNGIKIYSCEYPDYNRVEHILYVMGNKSECNTREVVIPYEDAKAVFLAIEEYNNTEFDDVDKKEKIIANFKETINKFKDLNKEFDSFYINNPDMLKEFDDILIKEVFKRV